VLVGLGLTENAEEHLAEQAAALDAAWRTLAAAIATTGDTTDGNSGGGSGVRVEVGPDGRARIRVDPLRRVDEPASLVALRELTARMMPQVDLPELLLEVHVRTGYLAEFTHASGGEARMTDAELSLAAVLVAEACNVGYKPVERDGHPALSRSRLSHTEQLRRRSRRPPR
jgi:Tn3 transposase DDE domain